MFTAKIISQIIATAIIFRFETGIGLGGLPKRLEPSLPFFRSVDK